jgi:hypothetical protein
MLISIFGHMGYGKTLLAVYLCYKAFSKFNYPIFSNIKLNFPYKPITIDNILSAKIKKGIVLLDEAYAYIESRASMRKINRIFSYILFQSRKRQLHFILTSQLYSTIDKRFRDLSDLLIIALEPDANYFNYFITDNQRYKIFKFPKKEAEKYYQLYDTREIVIPLDFFESEE